MYCEEEFASFGAFLEKERDGVPYGCGLLRLVAKVAVLPRPNLVGAASEISLLVAFLARGDDQRLHAEVVRAVLVRQHGHDLDKVLSWAENFVDGKSVCVGN